MKIIKKIKEFFNKTKSKNKHLPKVESPYSNWAKILFYMNDVEEANASDFMERWKWWFVWYNANARLSELSALWYVKHIWTKITEKKTFWRNKKVRIFVYKISALGRKRAEYLANKL